MSTSLLGRIAPGAFLVIVAGAAPLPLDAAIFTVGPGGTHATIQEAITAATSAAGDDEVRIATGIFAERIAAISFQQERTDISGGWNASFDAQTADPALTVVDAGLLGSAFSADVNVGIMTLRNLRLTRGAGLYSGNAWVVVRDSARFELSDCELSHGRSPTASGESGYGAGIMLQAFNASSAAIERCRIHDNVIEQVTGGGSGAGLNVAAQQTAQIVLSELDVRDNRLTTPGGSGAGLSLYAAADAEIELSDSQFIGNSIAGNSVGSGIWATVAEDSARIRMRRLQVSGNGFIGSGSSVQLAGSIGGSSELVVGDSLVADSDTDGGVYFFLSPTAQARLVNVTLAGNAQSDLALESGVTVTNSLADIATNVAAATVVRSRLNFDPGYVDRAGGDYRLAPDSLAIGAGTLTPSGGLGPLDLEGNPRVRGYGVDLGAFEADDPSLFVDGFEPP